MQIIKQVAEVSHIPSISKMVGCLAAVGWATGFFSMEHFINLMLKDLL